MRRALDTQNADTLYLSLPVDVSRVEIEHALTGVSKGDHPRCRWREREGRGYREWEGEGPIVTRIDNGRDLLLLAVWPCNVQSNRRFQVGVDAPVDHGSSSIIRPERV